MYTVFLLVLTWYNDLCTPLSTKCPLLLGHFIFHTGFTTHISSPLHTRAHLSQGFTMAGRQCCVSMRDVDDHFVPDLVSGTYRLFLIISQPDIARRLNSALLTSTVLAAICHHTLYLLVPTMHMEQFPLTIFILLAPLPPLPSCTHIFPRHMSSYPYTIILNAPLFPTHCPSIVSDLIDYCSFPLQDLTQSCISVEHNPPKPA